MRIVGVPYESEQIASAARDAESQAAAIMHELVEDGGVRACGEGGGECDLYADSQLVALIGYLQRLGNPPREGASGEGVEVSLNTDGGER